jgi:dTDP-glucose pyrophosphorylase
MGGLGTRFAQVGIDTPKPLIEIEGKPMIFKAVSSFERLMQRTDVHIRLVFIVRQEHQDKYELRTKLEAVFSNFSPERLSCVFVMMTRDTRGAAETCLLAKDALLPDAPVVIMDCDLYFKSQQYEDLLLEMASEGPQAEEEKISGLLVHFTSKSPRYSYALIDSSTGLVVKTAEKNPISDCSLIGAYGFGSGRLFVSCAEELLLSPIDPEKGIKEYFISLVFNFVLAKGLKVKAVPRDEYASFGTPDEMALFLAGKPSYVTE